MANCSENLYVIRYTDVAKGTISIVKSSLVTDVVDITLVGKTRKEYGEVFNDNILHLLEGFSCPEDATDVDGNTPDATVAFAELLTVRPVIGQRWYNSTRKRSHFYDGDGWVAMTNTKDVIGISGIMQSGNFLPNPVDVNGTPVPYSECIWSVSPYGFYVDEFLYFTYGEIEYMKCYATALGQVFMEFRFVGSASVHQGLVNYTIIALKGNTNIGTIAYTPA